MELRPYQIRILDDVWDALHEQLNSLIVAPCGAGKTILFSKIIQRLLAENPAFRALILVDREILVTQSAEKLRSVAPELVDSIGIICASVSAIKDGGKSVTIASRQSLTKQLDTFQPVQLCILDEAHLVAIPHHGGLVEQDQYAEIIGRLRGYNPMMRLIGCTASPYRLGKYGGYIYGDRNRASAIPYWDSVTASASIKEMINAGYLAPLVGRVAIDSSLAGDLKNVPMLGGEYNISQLSMVMSKTVHVQSCVDAWHKYASDRKKTVVFCTTIEHAEIVATAFIDAGVSALAIHSKLNAVEGAAAMAELAAGSRRVFTSVAKLTTGMDVTDIDCIMLARPTKSTALYMQICGRGARIAPGKKNCLIIDLVGATQEFGTDMDNLKVALPSEAEGGEAPTKICPGKHADDTVCAQTLHASLRYCPHCGHYFPPPQAEDGEVGDLKEVKFNAPEPKILREVNDVSYYQHTSRGSQKDLIRVSYLCGLETFDEYVCLPDFYQGYAVDKARAWWKSRSDEPFPASVDEFIFLSGSLEKPLSIITQKEGKHTRIIEAIMEVPF